MRIVREKYNLLSLLLLLLVFLQFSCKTTYEIGQKQAHVMSDNKLYNHIVDNSLIYKTLWVKRFSANYESNRESQNIKGSLKILRDSIIMMQINAPTGILEVARIYISPDSIKILDRLKKTYLVTDFTYLSDKLNMDVDFFILQSILTNDIFQLQDMEEKQRAFIRNFKSKVLDDKYVFISDKGTKIERKLRKDKQDKLHRFDYQRIEIDPSLMKITDILIKEFSEERNISLKYRDFIDLEGQKFPSELNFKVKDPSRSISCKLKYNRLVLDEELQFPFKVTSTFKRVYPE